MENKETLEEVALRLYPEDISDHDSCSMVEYDSNLPDRLAFIEGYRLAEQNSSKMYSEEEVIVLLHKRDKHNTDNQNTFNGWMTPKEWLNNLKKIHLMNKKKCQKMTGF